MDDDLVPVPDATELWVGEMEEFEVGDRDVLVVRTDDGFVAYDAICPHQSYSLVDGSLEGSTLTCAAHEWQFDITTGDGINPAGECLPRHATEIIDGVLHVSREPVGAGSRVEVGSARTTD